jgi:hypothetical protein
VKSLGKGPSYIRFSPNLGFSLRIWNRWPHWCRACGWTLLKKGESRRAVRPKRR